MVTECLRDDHRTIQAALAEVEESVATTRHGMTELEHRWGALAETVTEHLRKEDEVLMPYWQAISGDRRAQTTTTHERQQQQLRAVETQLTSARTSIELSARQLADLMQGMRSDMQLEEDMLFPDVEHMAGPGVPEAGVGFHRRWGRLVFVSLGAASTVLLLRPSPVDHHPSSPPSDHFAPRGVGGTSAPPEQVPAAYRLMIQYHGRVVSFAQFAKDALQFITGVASWVGEDAVRVVSSIMVEPTQWEDCQIVWVSSNALRERLNMRPGTTHSSYLALATSSVFLPMVMETLEQPNRSAGVTPFDRELLLVYERFVRLQALLKQEVSLLPPPSGITEALPVLHPTDPAFRDRVLRACEQLHVGFVTP